MSLLKTKFSIKFQRHVLDYPQIWTSDDAAVMMQKQFWTLHEKMFPKIIGVLSFTLLPTSLVRLLIEQLLISIQ
jgi:hypothetical protein